MGSCLRMNGDWQSLLFRSVLGAESAPASADNTPEDACGHATRNAQTPTNDEIFL